MQPLYYNCELLNRCPMPLHNPGLLFAKESFDVLATLDVASRKSKTFRNNNKDNGTSVLEIYRSDNRTHILTRNKKSNKRKLCETIIALYKQKYLSYMPTETANKKDVCLLNIVEMFRASTVYPRCTDSKKSNI